MEVRSVQAVRVRAYVPARTTVPAARCSSAPTPASASAFVTAILALALVTAATLTAALAATTVALATAALALPAAAFTTAIATAPIASTVTSTAIAIALTTAALAIAVVTAASRLPRHLRHCRRQRLPGRGLGCLWVNVRVWDRLCRLRPAAPSRPASLPASVPSAAAAKALAAATIHRVEQTATIRSSNRAGSCDSPHYQLHCRGHH